MNKLTVPRKYIGVPFKESGTNFDGADCINLTKLFVEDQLSVKVKNLPPDTIKAQRNNEKYLSLLEDIPFDSIIPGDILFFSIGSKWHCAIYVGYGKILNSSRPIFKNQKAKSSVAAMRPGWKKHYLGAIRTQGKTEIVVPDAGWPVIGWGIMILTTIYSVVTALTAPKPKFGNDTGSPKYGFSAISNTMTNELIYPLPFGRIKYGGNTIWYKTAGGNTKRFMVLGIGQIESISDVRVNDIPIADLPGCSYTAYLGTPGQTVDSRAAGEVKGLRNIAYIAVTLETSEKLPGGDPTVTMVVEGLLMKTWNGSIWTGSSYSRNPAACARQLLIIPGEDGGGGVDEAELDDAAFGEVYDHCAELIDDGDGGTHARHQFDFTFDVEKPILDALKEVLQPYGIYFILGEKIGIKILKEESTEFEFDMDNINAGSFNYYEASKDESFNEVKVRYTDPDQNDVGIDVTALDHLDQVSSGVVRKGDFAFLGINRFAEAARRAEFIKNESNTNVIWCELNTDINALQNTAGDVGTVTHDLPAWIDKSFRIMKITEENDFTRHVILKEETASIHNDAMSSVIETYDYGSPANAYDPVTDVTDLVITEGIYYLHKDGTASSDILVNWTAPTDDSKRFLKYYQIELKKGSGEYEVTAVIGKNETSFLIYGVEDEITYKVRVKTISSNDVISDGLESADLTVLGKLNKPVTPTGFSVSQEANILKFICDVHPEIDFAYFVIKKGPEWSAGEVIAERADLTDVLYPVGQIGTQVFMIKAVDRSGLESEAPAIDEIIVTAPPSMNFLNDFDQWSVNLSYKLTNMELVYRNDYNLGYVRPVFAIRTATTWEEREAEAQTWEYQEANSGLLLDRPVESSGSFEMIDPVDLGIVFEFKVVVDADYKNVDGGTLTVQINTSEDGITYSGFTNVDAGAAYRARYVLFKHILATSDVNHNVYFYGATLFINAPVAKVAWVRDVAIPIGGKEIIFGVDFSYAPRVTANIVNGAVGVVVISGKTADKCDADCYNMAGAAIDTAEIDLTAQGY